MSRGGTLLSLVALCTVGWMAAARADEGWGVSAYDKYADGHTFNGGDGNVYRIVNTKYSRGRKIRMQDGKRTRWKKHGTFYSLRSKDGSIASQQDYHFGTKHGEYKTFTDKGSLKFHAYYEEGKLEGTYTHYRDDGTIFDEIPYKKGKKHGKKVQYHHKKGVTRAQPNFTTDYVEGKRHGEVLQYDYKGKLLSRSTYQNGKKVGKTEWIK